MKLIFFIIWSKFSTSYYKNQTTCLPTFWGRVLHHPTNISPMTTLSAIPYTVSKKSHMIWHVIVLNNNILIYSFILEILNFNDLFSYCPSNKKRSYLSALPPVCDIVDAEGNGELCNHSWPMSRLTVIQYRTTCTDWIMLSWNSTTVHQYS